MPNCIVKHCKNYPSKVTKKDGISYFHFPRDPERCAVWRKIISKSRGQDIVLRTNTVVCSDHFDEQDMYSTGKGLRRLKKAAVPTLQLNNSDSVPIVSSVFIAPNGIVIKTEKPDELQVNDGYSVPIVNSVHNECNVPNGIVIKTEKPDEDELQLYDGNSVANIDSVNNECHTPNGIVIKTEKPDELQLNDGFSVPIVSSIHNEYNTLKKSANSKDHDDTITCEVSTSTCQDCIVNNARVVTLSKNLTSSKKLIKRKNRKIVNLQKQNERLKERNSYLKNVIKLLKKSENDRYLYRKLSDRVEVKELLNAIYLKNVKNKKRPFSVYPPAAKLFAVTLHSHSPAAYNYFRKTFHYCLPHTSTLQEWYKKVGVELNSAMETQDPVEEESFDYKQL